MLGQEAVQAGDPDVVQAIDRIPHQFGGNGRFLGHRQVGRAGRRDEDGAPSGWQLPPGAV